MMITEGCYKVGAYGGYRLTARKTREGYSQLTMYDLGALRFPFMWSKELTNEQAKGAFDLFYLVGYFKMPDG